MASLFNSLNVGYSGLTASQVGINTTGQNIANAETPGYTRQRVVNAASTPLSNATPGAQGSGVSVTEITRVFDAFVYNRYSDSSQSKEYSDFMRQSLEELSTYFPDIEGVGIKADLQNYYNTWQTLVDNPDSTAVKTDLAQQSKTLATHISQTRDQVFALQSTLDDQLNVAVDEVNRLAKSITDLNRSITETESGGLNNANDLRDQRDLLQLSLSKLINAEVFVDAIESNTAVSSSINEAQGNYTIHVGGYNIVDGTTFHPIGIDSSNNKNGFSEIYYQRQDGEKIPLESRIKGGKVGAIFDLRGSDVRTDSGTPDDGILQETINDLDAFAASLIEYTNTIYAQGATGSMLSNEVNVNATQELVNTDLNINTGTFDINIYDIDGAVVSTRSINIDEFTSLTGVAGSNSIEGQVSDNIDDNGDNNSANDIDDFIQFAYAGGKMSLSLKGNFENEGYTFSLSDQKPSGELSSGTNFSGAMGLNRFFDGDDASNIKVSSKFADDPSTINAFKAPISGDNGVALDMVQMQFEDITFRYDNTQTQTDTIYAFYDTLATNVGVKTNAAVLFNDTMTAQYNAVELEYSSISKVSIDEELTNLIKYQTAYGASAKVISTIDQMLNTLLGIKQ